LGNLNLLTPLHFIFFFFFFFSAFSAATVTDSAPDRLQSGHEDTRLTLTTYRPRSSGDHPSAIRLIRTISKRQRGFLVDLMAAPVHPAPSDANGTRTLLCDSKESLYVGPISAEPLNTTLVFKPIKMIIMEDHVQVQSLRHQWQNLTCVGNLELATLTSQFRVDRGYDLKVHLYQLVLKLKVLLARACLRPIASRSQFRKAQDFLALLDALCNWSYVTQLFSKSERSSHLCRMIVDIVITELLRCMVLISCVSEGNEPFVRSKNFNLYVMDEAVSITFSLIQTRMMERKISRLNEGLQAVSKNLGDIIESLANCCCFCPLQFTIARKTRFAKSISLVMRWKLSVHLRFFACLASKLEKSKQSP
ncbi:hypothetical protein LINPERHAP2_LOCUS23620, partial [Linum perenne]